MRARRNKVPRDPTGTAEGAGCKPAGGGGGGNPAEGAGSNRASALLRPPLSLPCSSRPLGPRVNPVGIGTAAARAAARPLHMQCRRAPAADEEEDEDDISTEWEHGAEWEDVRVAEFLAPMERDEGRKDWSAAAKAWDASRGETSQGPPPPRGLGAPRGARNKQVSNDPNGKSPDMPARWLGSRGRRHAAL